VWGIGLPAAPHLPEVDSLPCAWGILLEFIEFIEFVEFVEFIWFGPTCVGSRVQGLGVESQVSRFTPTCLGNTRFPLSRE
jgi:hypothetical protein